MKHMEGGYIGRQETAYLLGIPLYLNGVFTLESQYAYQGGNSTYIWVPLSIVLSLGIFLLLLLAMERAGARDLGELFEAGLGKTLGRGCMALLALLLLLGGPSGDDAVHFHAIQLCVYPIGSTPPSAYGSWARCSYWHFGA